MIADALDFIAQELRRTLGVAEGEVTAGSAQTLADRTRPPGVFLSVVNLHEEVGARNLPNVDGVSHGVEPPLHLNIDVLCAFEFDTYGASLTRLSQVLEQFQRKPWYSPATQSAPDATPFPAALDSLAVEGIALTLEELHDLWGVLGTAYMPSVVYRVRLVKGSPRDAAAMDWSSP